MKKIDLIQILEGNIYKNKIHSSIIIAHGYNKRTIDK